LKDKLMGANERQAARLIAATGKELHPILEPSDRSEMVPLAACRRAVISMAKGPGATPQVCEE
jgi:hypothetical protein